MTDAAEPTVALDAAQAEFDTWIAAMGLTTKLDPSGLDDSDRKSLAQQKRTLIAAIQDGRLHADENGQFVLKPVSGEQITFYEPTGAALLIMDKKSKDHDNAKMFASMANFTKQTEARFSAMPMRDLEICRAVTLIFLG